MRRIRNIILVLITLTLFSSCRFLSSIFHDDEVVARVGKKMLYRSEVAGFIPDGVSVDDSLRFALQYINRWASDIVFLDLAEEQLSKSEKDVSKELEDYRRSLLKYRYEQAYVNERLDTAVAGIEIEDYYKTHRNEFILSHPIVKARALKISTASSEIDRMKKNMSSFELDAGWALDEMETPEIGRFHTYSDKWIEISYLCSDMEMNPAMFSNVRAGRFYESIDGYGLQNIVYIAEAIPAGVVAPLEYCWNDIKDVIINARKHKLTTTLEQDLLETARDKGHFVVY